MGSIQRRKLVKCMFGYLFTRNMVFLNKKKHLYEQIASCFKQLPFSVEFSVWLWCTSLWFNRGTAHCCKCQNNFLLIWNQLPVSHNSEKLASLLESFNLPHREEGEESGAGFQEGLRKNCSLSFSRVSVSSSPSSICAAVFYSQWVGIWPSLLTCLSAESLPSRLSESERMSDLTSIRLSRNWRASFRWSVLRCVAHQWQ